MSLPRSHHHPAHLSPHRSPASPRLAGLPAPLQAGFPCPTSPSLRSLAPVALPVVLAGAFFFLSPSQGLSTSLLFPPTQACARAPLPRRPCALLLLGSQSTCRWPGLALHISHCAFCQPSPLVSWVTTRIQTRRASHALGGLSAHLSPMCLSGRQQMCPLQRLLPQPLWSPILQHLGTDTFLILHPSGSMVGLGHPAPPHLHSGSKHGPGRSILKSQP